MSRLKIEQIEAHQATGTPAVTDDITKGFLVGHLWADTNAKKTYICNDNTSGTAVWLEIGTGSGGEWTKSGSDVTLTTATDLVGFGTTASSYSGSYPGVKNVVKNNTGTNDVATVWHTSVPGGRTSLFCTNDASNNTLVGGILYTPTLGRLENLIWDTVTSWADDENTAHFNGAIVNASTNVTVASYNPTNAFIPYRTLNVDATSNSVNVNLPKIDLGRILYVTISVAGSGYSVGDSLTINGGTAGVVYVTSVDGGGGVTGINLISYGFGYTAGVKVTAGGGGAGSCSVNIAIIPYAGLRYTITKVVSTANTVTITPEGTDTIMGASSMIVSNNCSYDIESFGADWLIR